ncbi:MAG: hypothetical protein C0392_11135 [Syntrophus sp. (in: bacteria)]|nr:hypothetical protein [Syntrophus sp. (in: bacteria)]
MTPNILSLEFHAKFFPRLLWSRLRLKKKRTEGTSFTSTMELTLAVFICLILIVVGLPIALSRGSIAGLISGVLGLAGILFLVISSALSQRGTRPTYDSFLIGIFFFFVFLGLTAGLFIGSVNHLSRGAGICASILGVLAGYITGIFGGLWAQYLGWIAGLLNGFAGLMIIGMVVVDILLLFSVV